MRLLRLQIGVAVVRRVQIAQRRRIESGGIAGNRFETAAQFSSVAEIAGVLARVAVNRVMAQIQLKLVAVDAAVQSDEGRLGLAIPGGNRTGDRTDALALPFQPTRGRPAAAELHHIAPQQLLNPGAISTAVGVGAEVLGRVGGALLRDAQMRLPSGGQLVVAEQLIQVLRGAAEIGIGRTGVGAIAVVAGAALATECAQAQRLPRCQGLHDRAVHRRVAVAVVVRVGIAELGGVDCTDTLRRITADPCLQGRVADLSAGIGRHGGRIAAARGDRDRGLRLFAARACGDQHHSADRARAVDGRHIAADDLDALNLIGGEVVEIRDARGVLCVHGHAVEQHQYIRPAKTAHIHIARLPRATVARHLHASHLQQGREVLRTALLDLLAGDHADARQGIGQRLRVARGRHHHRRQRGGVGRSGLRLRVQPDQTDGRGQRGAKENRLR